MTPEHFQMLADAGLTVEQIGVVMRIMAEAEGTMKAAEESRKAQVRERVQRWRDRHKDDVTLPKRNGNGVKRLTRVEDSSSKLEISGKEGKKDSAAKPRGDLDAFKAELSPILDPDRIEALVAVRRKKGATFSAYAGRILVKALRACPSVADAADEMILRNWTGIKPDWLESKQQPRSGAPPPKPKTVGDIFRDDAKRMGLIPDDQPPDTETRRMAASNGSGEGGGTGIARRFAVAGDILGSIGPGSVLRRA